MNETSFGMTDPGLQRNNNEDTFIAEPAVKGKFVAASVIDGVGGYLGGEVAAEIARKAILQYLVQTPGADPLTMAKEALVFANEKIFEEKQRNTELDKMSCVATLALVEKKANRFYYAHVGDTRLYLFRDDSLVKISKDHSFVGLLEDSGRLEEQAAMAHPNRNEINRALGFESPLPDPEYIELGTSPFLPGDLLLLCSDGLTDMINRQEITGILQSPHNLKTKAKALVDAANRAGGKDNITVVLVQNNKAPVKQKASRPAKTTKSESDQQPQGGWYQSSTSSYPIKKSSTALIIFLALLSLFSIAGFLWLWLRDAQPNTSAGSFQARVKNREEQRLQDTLRNMAGTSLVLSQAVFGNPIFLTDTLFLDRDSIVISGENNTLLVGDTGSSQIPLVIGPGTRHISFDNLTMRHLSIIVPVQNSDAFYLNNVRMQNATVATVFYLDDTLVKGHKVLPANGEDTSKPQN